MDTKKKENDESSEPCDFPQNINTDDRKQYEWLSKYPSEARKKIRKEAIYVFALLFIASLLFFLNFMDVFSTLLKISGRKKMVLTYIVYFMSSGLLGGLVFGIKYFYRTVARGWWHDDRRYWRYFSPIISMFIALIIGTMVVSGLIESQNGASNTWAISFGFFSGYFADEAVGKMYEVASVFFGKAKQE